MTIRTSRLAASVAALTAFSLVAPPAMAQGWGWGGGWGHRRHHDGIDAGDVITGILIIGGIAAIASAASSNDRDRDRRRDDDRRERDQDYQRDPAPSYAPNAGPSWNEGGIGTAVDRCMQEVSSGNGRDAVDSVGRAGQGWRVQGHTGEGKAFSCTVDGNGRIRNISVEGEEY